MRKTDISNYSEETVSGSSVSALSIIGNFFSSISKLILTIVLIVITTGIVVAISTLIYIIGIASEPLPFDLDEIKLSLTSFVWIKNEETDEFEKYMELYSSTNRVWVPYQDIPKDMINAQIAIEDKRFYDHNGVDPIRTGGAILTLATGGADYGGSTITQQLIKNITNDNEVSITRKLREIFRALKLEEQNSKDDIIEAYLNIVNYGSGCNGVQAAARLYYNKDIKDCSIAECAAIAGITQNPYLYDPLVFPEKTKTRARHVLYEMFTQGKIDLDQYTQALTELGELKFIGYEMEDDDDDDESDWNWYMDRIYRDVLRDLQRKLGIDSDTAEDMIYNKGLNIYSAMDLKTQNAAEKIVRDWKTPGDPTLNIGYEMLDLEGRVLATVGGRTEKDGRLVWDNVTMSVLQPGSTIKPIATYAPAINNKLLNFSAQVEDNPVPDWNGSMSGPINAYGTYYGKITVTKALDISSNAAAVHVLDLLGMENSYNFLTQVLNFTHLNPEEDSQNRAGLSIGGFNGGVTIDEMAAAYVMFGNGGFYYEPYTYYYVEDSEGNVILDNRDRGKPMQAITPETATIMNRLLHEVVYADGAFGYRAQVDGWDIIGKTGTTDSACDNWFVGCSPYAAAAIWTGHNTNSPIAYEEQTRIHYLWAELMKEYLKDKPSKSYSLGGDVVQQNYHVSDGYITNYPVDRNVAVGYYTKDNMPPTSRYDPNPVEQESDDDDEDSKNEDDTGDGENDGENGENGDNTGDDNPGDDNPGDDNPTPDGGGGDDNPTPDGGGDDNPTPDGGGGDDNPTPDGGGGDDAGGGNGTPEQPED